MQPKDPTLSRKLFELESGVKTAPRATLDHLLVLEQEDFPREIVAKMRLLRVRLLIYFEQFEEARDHLQETRRLINSQTDVELSAYFQLLLAEIKHHACDPESALDLIDAALPVLADEPLQPTTAEFLLEPVITGAHAAIDLAQYARALSYLEYASTLLSRFGLECVEALSALARLQLHLHHFDLAKRVSNFASNSSRSDAVFDYPDLMLARSLQATGNIQECLDTCSSGFIGVRRRSIEPKLRLIVGECFQKMNELTVARGYMQESLDHATSITSERDIAKGKLFESAIYKAEGNFEQALRSLDEVAKSPAALNIRHIRHRVLAERAWLLARLDRHQESASSYDELFELRFEAQQLAEHGKVQQQQIDGLLAKLGIPSLGPSPPPIEERHQRHPQAGELVHKLLGVLDQHREKGKEVEAADLQWLETELQRYLDSPTSSDSEIAATERHFKSALLSVNPSLTSTELKICALIRDDHSSVQIAYKLDVSVRTVDAHRRNIRRKLGLDASSNLRSFLLKF